jgi:site-specific recombinase XerD
LKGVCFPKVPKGIPKSLPLDAAENLLRYARNMRFRTRFEGARAYALLATLIFTGIRKAELLNLELCDVDLERRVLAVRRGKGGKDRLLPILPQLNEALRPYLEIRNTSTRSKSPYFFIGRDSNGRIPDVVLRRAIDRIRSKSGVHFAPHMMRHTFATLMLQGGCDVFSLSKLMGHSDIKTTTIYLSATIDHLREQAMKFPVLSGGVLNGLVANGSFEKPQLSELSKPS